MSVSLFIYSPDPPLTRDQVISACRNEQLSLDERWEIAFRQYDGSPAPATPGLLGIQRVLGWRPNAPETAAVRSLLESDDRAAIDELYSSNHIAAVTLDVVTRDQDEWPVDDELIEQTPPELRDDVANAHTWYNLETNAGRNRLSSNCQEHLWAIIGALSKGVMEDPQDGQYKTRDGRSVYDQPPQIISNRRPLPG